jgi:hypothetical protein
MRRLGRLSVQKVQEESLFPMEERSPSQEELRRALLMKWNAKVFGWKGATCEAQDVGDVKLNM